MRDFKKQYAEKFKDPRWQKLRLEILERDEWTCQMCDDKESTLHIHHRYYLENTEPWEYPIESLSTLCENCHEAEKEELRIYKKLLIDNFMQKFWADDMREIAWGLSFLEPMSPGISNYWARAYSWAFKDNKIRKEIMKKYLKQFEAKAKKRNDKSTG